MFEDYIYDVETYPNAFTVAVEHAFAPLKWSFEISEFNDQREDFFRLIHYIRNRKGRLVGFNNINFDYPVLHLLLTTNKVTPENLYQKAQQIIQSQTFDENAWKNIVPENERVIEQLDLFKIHHFDNKARATSLKILEFNMRSESIQELPFPVGTILDQNQIETLKKYNAYDVAQTKQFYHHSVDMIKFREELSKLHNRNFMNHNDTKIGKDFFIMELEKSGVKCFENKKPIQTIRPRIDLKDAILPSIEFEQPKFNEVLNWLKSQTITETKNAFKDLKVMIDGFPFVFGTGGIHGSIENEIVESNDEYVIVDLDVASYYPNLAIENDFYPHHLTIRFCQIYKNLYEQRKYHLKGSAINAMLKLALNGVYGDSNNPYSPFYDPLFTMKITLNGQLLLCQLAEQLMKISRLLQINTDGLTVKVKRIHLNLVQGICEDWTHQTGLNLEQAYYRKMCIRDVNNYIAEYEDGKIKRKGAYEYEMGWHQNHSMLVVPKVAELVLLKGQSISGTLRNWEDPLDFLLRTKVPRSSELWLEGDEVDGWENKMQNITRYYISTDGGSLFKYMPPLKGKTEMRKFAVNAGKKVTICNDFDPIEMMFVDYSFYQDEVEKLVLPLRKMED
jgi:hypothetical protein